MRVISGSVRGRKLKGPRSHATRPMADKIKGALFNAMLSLDVHPERILDLYAGTGNIGIEALSRGGSWADFVEKGRDQVKVIQQNLETTGFSQCAKVHHMPVGTFLATARGEPYDFIVLDPPYADPEILRTLASVESSQLVQSGTIVVLGHWPRLEVPDTLGRLECLRNRCHGDSCFSIFEVVAADVVDQAPSGEGQYQTP
jgi:16S rRNA (guanine966-N2)-methyltransferase